MIFKKSLFAKIRRKPSSCGRSIFEAVTLGVFAALFASACSSDTNDNNIAGGVTDIGNSVATTKIEGIVTNLGGTAVPSARVVAYYDNWDQTTATDSVVVTSDSNGKFALSVDSSASFILFAESGDECGLAYASVDSNNTLILGSRRHIESSVSGESSGYMRIVGTDKTAKIAPDGSFAFDEVPPGDISLVFIRDDKPQGHLDFRTTDDRDRIYLPPMENRRDDGSFAPPELGDDMFGVEFGRHEDPQEPAFLNIVLHLDDFVPLFNGNTSSAYNDNIIEGVVGNGVTLKQGQYLDAGTIDFLRGDYTLSLWLKWDGPSDSNQILFSQVSAYPNVSFWNLQWIYDSESERFGTVSMQDSSTIFFGDSTTLPRGQWFFLVIVNSNNNATLYINGLPVDTHEVKPSHSSEQVNPGGSYSLAPFRIGGEAGLNQSWNGSFDEIHIEGIAHSPNWVKSIYDMTSSPRNQHR